MPITALPTPPSRQDPTNFANRADEFLGALPAFATQANALEAEYEAAATAAAEAVLTSKLNNTNPSYTGTLTGGTGVVNLGSGQFYKDAAGNVGVDTTDTSSGRFTVQAGTGATGNSLVLSNADGVYNPFLQIQHNGINGIKLLNSSSYGGTAGNLTFAPGGIDSVVMAASGNFGLGVTPSAANLPTFESEYGLFTGRLGATIAHNAYYDGSYRYSTTNFASRYLQQNGVHTWFTAPSGTAGNPITFTQAMTLDASGNLLVGTTSAAMHTLSKTISGDYATRVLNQAGSNPYGLSILYSGVGGGAGNDFFACQDDATRFRVLGNGNAQNVNNSYGAISDLKLKENIVDVTPKLAKLLQVRIVNYTLKADHDKTKLIGVIAQELEQISPGLIEETPDYEEVKKTREVEVPAVEAVLDAEGNEVAPAVPATTRTEEYTERVPLGTVTKSVKYSVFVPMLIKGVQEQQAQIEALQSQLDTQNTAMQLLVARLEALEAK